MKKTIIGLFVCIFCFLSGFSQRISRQQALDDLDTLYSKILEIHPDPFAVCSKRMFERELHSVRNGLPDSLSIQNFFLSTAPLVAMLGDAHTSISCYAMICSSSGLFPLRIRLDARDTSMYVLNDFSDTGPSIPSGVCILRINGTDVKPMLGDMMRYVSGERPFYRLQALEDKFFGYFHLLHGASTYTIEYRNGNCTQSKTIDYIQATRYFEKLKELPERTRWKEPYAFRVLPGEIGLIEYNACQEPDRFARFLDSVFTVMRDRKIDCLIVDARDNGGGNSSLNDEFFQYISPVPFAQVEKMVFRVSDPVRKRFGPEFERRNGVYRSGGRNLTPLRENPLRYRGKTFLLVGHRTFSSAGMFSGAFKEFGMGTVVGEESGGMNIHFGEVIGLTLPNSGHAVTVSCKKFCQWGARDGDVHGTLPDYEIPADEALDYTLKNLVGERNAN